MYCAWSSTSITFVNACILYGTESRAVVYTRFIFLIEHRRPLFYFRLKWLPNAIHVSLFTRILGSTIHLGAGHPCQIHHLVGYRPFSREMEGASWMIQQICLVLTNNFSYFFSLVGSSVKIHSTTTGLVVSTLTAPPSSNARGSNVLTSAVLNPQNSFQILVATLDGRILIWDFINATLLQTINVGQHIHLICAHERFKGFVFVAASAPNRKENGK